MTTPRFVSVSPKLVVGAVRFEWAQGNHHDPGAAHS